MCMYSVYSEPKMREEKRGARHVRSYAGRSGPVRNGGSRTGADESLLLVVHIESVGLRFGDVVSRVAQQRVRAAIAHRWDCKARTPL